MTDVFDQNTPPANPPVAPVTSNLFDDKLKTIVNDQGQPKYKSVEDALEALKASQVHIKQLETEQSVRDAEILRLREETKTKEALEAVVQRLANNAAPNPPVTPPSAGLSEDAIAKLVGGVLDQRSAEQKAQANIDSVSNVLSSKFGDKTKEMVANKAAELGMTPQELGTLSSTKPALVLSLFGEKAPAPANPVTPSVSTPLGTPPTDTELKRPEKSLLVGPAATDKNRKALMAEIRKKVFKDLDVTE